MSRMDRDKLRKLFEESKENLERQPDCPDDYHLASYMEGGLSERDHVSFESHLADCAFCLERVGALGRAGESGSIYVEPEHAPGRSKKPAPLRRMSSWATAAVIVLAIGLTANQMATKKSSPAPGELQNPPAPSERSIEPVSPFPEILYPLEGGAVDPQSLVFRWKEVPGSLYYDIRIVSDDGAQVARQRVWDTQWTLPAEARLQTRAEYFVRVDAYVSEGKTVSSEHIVFSVGVEHP